MRVQHRRGPTVPTWKHTYSTSKPVHYIIFAVAIKYIIQYNIAGKMCPRAEVRKQNRIIIIIARVHCVQYGGFLYNRHRMFTGMTQRAWPPCSTRDRSPRILRIDKRHNLTRVREKSAARMRRVDPSGCEDTAIQEPRGCGVR